MDLRHIENSNFRLKLLDFWVSFNKQIEISVECIAQFCNDIPQKKSEFRMIRVSKLTRFQIEQVAKAIEMIPENVC